MKCKTPFVDAIGKRYARLLKRVSLKDKALVLHRRRHTGITRLANAGANDKVRSVFVGHAGQDVQYRIYNHGIPLPFLQEELQQSQYPEVVERLHLSSVTTDQAA